MIRIALLAIVLATPAFADVKGPGGRIVECYCTDTQGLRVELGDTICLMVDGRAFMAQCDMSLNVPIWRDTGVGCLSSSAEPSLRQQLLKLGHPSVETGPVEPPV